MNLYDSIIEAVERYELPANERGQLYTAVIEYLYWGREPDFKMGKAAGLCYEAMKPVFDKQRERKKAGKNGGKAKANRLANAKQTPSKTLANDPANAKQTPSEQEQELKKRETNVSQKKNAETEKPSVGRGESPKAEKPQTRFVPPSPAEVDAYIAEKGYSGFNGEQFCAFYASKGWKVGNQPMKSWRQACVTWQYRNGGGTARVPLDPEIAAYNFDVGGVEQ